MNKVPLELLSGATHCFQSNRHDFSIHRCSLVTARKSIVRPPAAYLLRNDLGLSFLLFRRQSLEEVAHSPPDRLLVHRVWQVVVRPVACAQCAPSVPTHVPADTLYAAVVCYPVPVSPSP